MRRLLNTLHTDFLVQARNRLYAIGLTVAVLIGLAGSLIGSSEAFLRSAPLLLLFVVGGSTLLYVGGMILFEKNEGTLDAVIVSPLRLGEYLWSKVISLSVLASVEGTVLVATGFLLRLTRVLGAEVESLPGVRYGAFFAGLFTVGVLYTLIGIITVVRFARVTDFLVPVLAIALALQLPAVHVSGLVEARLLYVIPTMAPTLLMVGAVEGLSAWEWVYAGGYTVAVAAGLYAWTRAAFHTHIVRGG